MRTEDKLEFNKIFNELEDKVYIMREACADCYDNGGSEEMAEYIEIVERMEHLIEGLRDFLDRIGANDAYELEKELGLIK